ASRPSRRASPTAALASLVAVLVAACSPGGPAPGPEAGRAAPGRGGEVVVASFNFPESVLVAEIYAGALEAAGVPVHRQLELGPRELVQPALLQGLVDVVPEYLGTALASLVAEPGVDPADAGAVRRRLAEAVAAWDLRVLDPAPAQNQNGLAVTRATAERHGLRTLSDLSQATSAAPGGLALSGPPECPTRAFCLPGLERVYGLRFARFVPFDSEHQRVTALREAVVDVAVMFTTDGELAGGDLVLLEDDRHLQPVENVVPLVSASALERHGPALSGALSAVSARLTAGALSFLNWRVAVAGRDPEAEARGWLARQGLAGDG
ncbi:MAG TPA: ABC transporter substrate-binding protein, partial [Acidimicrobiales bacterium]|nr:ABC transporter substrate-binding protein [Acidimicrobiales bacterium]